MCGKLDWNAYFDLLATGKHVEAEEYRQSAIPSRLLKFVSLEENEEESEKAEEHNRQRFYTLSSERIWCSRVSRFNDPYEMQGMYFDENDPSLGENNQRLAGLFQSMLELPAKNLAVSSLSSNDYSSLPMWAYYTNGHRGFCVEYEVIPSNKIFEVTYEPRKIRVNKIMTHSLRALCAELSGEGSCGDDLEFCSALLAHQAAIKHSSWKHEKEFRIIAPLDGKLGLGADSSRSGLNVPIIQVGLKTKAIYAGINCADQHVEKLAEIAKQLHCGPVRKLKTGKTDFVLAAT